MYFLIRRGGCSVCRYNETITPSQSQSLLLTTDQKFHNLQQMKCTFPRDITLIQNRIISPMIVKPFPSMSQHTKMLQKSRDPSGYFQVSDDLQKVAHYLPLLRRLSNNAEFRVWLSQVSWYLFTQLTSNWVFDSSCYGNKITEFVKKKAACCFTPLNYDYHEKRSPLIFILFLQRPTCSSRDMSNCTRSVYSFSFAVQAAANTVWGLSLFLQYRWWQCSPCDSVLTNFGL